VIDHHEARLFRSEMHGTVPQQLLPHAPDEYFRHEQNSQNLSRGKEKPDPNTFFEPVAKALQSATQLLIFGTGTGKSSEMAQFVMWFESPPSGSGTSDHRHGGRRRTPPDRKPAVGEGP